VGRRYDARVPRQRDDRSRWRESPPAHVDGRREQGDCVPRDVNRRAARALSRPGRTERLPGNTERLPRSESRVPARAFFLARCVGRGPRHGGSGEMLSPGVSSKIERGKMLPPTGARRGSGGSSMIERGKMLLPGVSRKREGARPYAESGPTKTAGGKILSPAVRGGGRGGSARDESVPSNGESVPSNGESVPSNDESGSSNDESGSSNDERGSSNDERGKMLLPGVPARTESGARRDERRRQLTKSA
jgi:hypothetical protein